MKQYGLIGYPLGHSFSKQYFTEKFEREGLEDCVFESFAIPDISQFPSLLSQNPGLKGLGVTIPYKEKVLKYVNELSEEVKIIGATNSIKITDNKLIAYNTDIIGFEESFSSLLTPAHKKALVLGTGGAAKAVQFVLNKLGIEYEVVTRDNTLHTACKRYDQIDAELMNACSLIINCSPAGMYPNENTAPDIPYELITPSHYLYDLVYKPASTLFMQKGLAKGAIVKNGYDMLLLQAEASWKIWNS